METFLIIATQKGSVSIPAASHIIVFAIFSWGRDSMYAESDAKDAPSMTELNRIIYGYFRQLSADCLEQQVGV